MKKSILAAGAFLVVTLLLALASGIPLMFLWNAVIPGIFPSVRTIDFGQAIGLMVICSLLFKNSSI